MRSFTSRSSTRANRFPLFILALAVLVTVGMTIRVADTRAASLSNRLSGDPQEPWQISAEKVTYEAAKTTYHARGDVIIEKQGTRLMADEVMFNHQAMTASASGHVIMTVGGDILTGERLDLDLARETGVLIGGSVFLEENHFFIRGQHIEKTGRDTYRAERAAITTCDGDSPDWVITGRTVDVTVEGYGRATHAMLKAGSLPVLYTPYLFFPVKTRRQTGLLMPEAGYSDRKGFFWDQPLFWAIDGSSDATLILNPMDKRGTKIGLEYRYALSDASYGTIMADGLDDRQTDDGGEPATEAWGYGDDKYDRPNSDRYWLRAKLDQELPAGLKARLDLDVVSDQDYLDDFKQGRSGFEATRDAFLATFNRDLDTYDENTRTNQLNLNRTWEHFAFNGDLLWNDNVVKRRWSDTDDTLQQLPFIAFNGTKQQIIDSGLYWDLDSEYTYFYREDGERGHRMDIHPRTYLPLRWKNYLSIEPSAGFRQTSWVMDRWSQDDLSRTSDRQIYDLELDLSTEFAKVFASPVTGIDRIRHSLKPQVVYTYIPNQDQSDLPDFTDLDRIERANRITYSLTNTFTARVPAEPPSESSAGDAAAARETVANALPADSEDPVRTFEYRRFCRFYLEQSYDIDIREDTPDRFADLYGELEIDLGRYVTVDADASYDTNDSRFSAHHLSGRISDRRGDRLWVEHRYKTSVNESISATLTVPLTAHFQVMGEYERNLLDEETLTRGIGMLFTAQCWSFHFRFAEEGDDRSVSALIHLTGIGGFGN